jgi:hypothetical protein
MSCMNLLRGYCPFTIQDSASLSQGLQITVALRGEIPIAEREPARLYSRLPPPWP